MIAVHMVGRGQVELRDLPDPSPQDDQVVVEVRASALCGGELRAFRGAHAHDPLSGRAVAGVVQAIDQAHTVRTGDRVVVFPRNCCGHCTHCRAGDWSLCRHQSRSQSPHSAHAQYLLVPEALCLPLPPDVSYDSGALIVGALGIAYHAIRRLDVNALDTVVVAGQGPLGLSVTLLCRLLGARVIAIEPRPYRRRLAMELGAESALDPLGEDVRASIVEQTGGQGADKAADCSSTQEGENLALDALRPRGRFAFVADTPVATIRPSEQIIHKEIDLFGCSHFNATEYEEVLGVLRRDLPLDQVITHRFPLSAAQSAFETLAKGECGAVILEPEFKLTLG